MSQYLRFCLCAVVLLSLTNCAGTKAPKFSKVDIPESPNISAKSLTISPQESGEEYLLQFGDEFDIKFYYAPELNEKNIRIRPDGKISLQLIDEIQAAGLTPSELEEELKVAYSKTLRKPEIAVIVKQFASSKVFVGGEVNSPGIVPISGRLTSTQAIFKAGGFKETANHKNVIIISRSPENIPVARKVNLKKVFSGKVPENDTVLRPFDIVIVPKTFIAKANKYMDQYIRQMIPGTLSAGFNYFVGKTRTSDRNSREAEVPSSQF